MEAIMYNEGAAVQPTTRFESSTDYSIYPTAGTKMSPVAPTSRDGFWTIPGGGDIKLFYQVVVETTGGNIIFEMRDGSLIFYPAISVGQLIPIGGARRIIDGAQVPINGGTSTAAKTTTAVDIWVFGGK